MKRNLFAWSAAVLSAVVWLPTISWGQVNSGSNGSDGAFNPTSDTVINMADHPDGIYQYTSVNIPNGLRVSFIPNAANTPVIWLVQGSVTIVGTIDLNGGNGVYSSPSGGSGPGGFRGGNPQGDGAGPGGGKGSSLEYGGNPSFGTVGSLSSGPPAGDTYGNSYLIPLIGGSGGGGSPTQSGAGGGGAMLIAANDTISASGVVTARGGNSDNSAGLPSGNGSGGAVRLVATKIRGNGAIDAEGGSIRGSTGYKAGDGRIRLDSPDNTFTGFTVGVISRGYQPIIIPPANQAVSLAIETLAGIAVPPSPAGAVLTPDVIIPGQQANPVSVVVRCVNIPLNTDILIDVKPANGPSLRVVGVNSAGTQASSTATVSVTVPRGAGTIQAKCISGIAGALGAGLNNGEKFRSYAQTGLTADGEVFAKMEITATLGRGQEIAYLTESGKRFVVPRN